MQKLSVREKEKWWRYNIWGNFLEKLELIEGITIIKMTRQGTGDEPLSLRQEPQYYNE